MTKEGWYDYTVCEQMSNIGAEVQHFIDARNKYRNGAASKDNSGFYFQKAIEYIDIISGDPKNKKRVAELEDCKKELLALRAGIFSDEYILKYWDQYTDACAFSDQRDLRDPVKK